MICVMFATNEVKSFGNFDGSLPWPHNKYDMLQFENTTKSIGTVVMGRATYESILSETKRMMAVNKDFVEPLSGRRSIILTTRLPDGRDLQYAELYKYNENLYFFNRETVAACFILEKEFKDICIIGGSGIIRDTIPFADKVYHTILSNNVSADITLKVDLPVHLDYLTSFPDKSGTLYHYSKEDPLNGKH